MSLAVATSESFEDEIRSADVVVVDFWAPWCGPCRSMLSSLDAVSQLEEFKAVKFVKINVDENPDISIRFGIRSIPVLKIFKEGHEVETINGNIGQGGIQTKVRDHV